MRHMSNTVSLMDEVDGLESDGAFNYLAQPILKSCWTGCSRSLKRASLSLLVTTEACDFMTVAMLPHAKLIAAQ